MKKRSLLSILFAFVCILSLSAQSKPVDPVFTAVTNKPVGEFVQLYLTSEDYFWVDWGNGTAKRYEKGAYGECNPIYPESGLKGSDIKIYGDDVTYIIAKDCGFTSAEAYMTNSPLWLELSNNPLESLNLDNCSMLGTLIADYCALTELNLGMKKKLQTLDVSNNKLQNVDISKCSNLGIVNISYNNIEGSITLPSLITQFDASNNNITGVDCTNSKKIEYLTLRKNNITSLDLTGIKSLIMCDASDNKISDVKFGGEYEYITTVSLRKNQLSSADFSALSDIHAIDISDNNFASVDITNNKSLTSFAADNNLLETIDLSNNADINFLYLCGNKFKSLDLNNLLYLHDFRADDNVLEDITMPNSADLICVMLKNNKLNTKEVDDLIEILPDVKNAYVYEWEKDWKQHLDLKGNSEAVYADLSKAETKGWVLDIKQQEKPKDMKGFAMTLGKADSYVFYISAADGTKVQMVNDSGDILGEATVDASLGMAELKVSAFISADANSANVVLQADNTITGIYAASQKIMNIDLNGYEELELLNISDNELDKLDVSAVVNLKELICSGNNISELNLGTLNINKVDCSKNNLTIATLPSAKNIKKYVYAPQNAFDAAYDGSGILDISSMFLCEDVESKFGVVAENGNVYAEGVDYTLDKGVISFLKPLGKVCVTVENEAFPDLSGDDILSSRYFEVLVSSGIGEITTDENHVIYDMNGRRVVSPLKSGLYIINGRKVVIK